jgi:hypothetical protein
VPFLLSTPAVTQLVSRKPNNVRDWSKQHRPVDVSASVISLAIIESELHDYKGIDRLNWLRYVQDFKHQFQREGRLLPVDVKVANLYSLLRGFPLVEDGEPIGEDEKMILATAIALGLTWVGRETEATLGLSVLGLKVIDPDEP